MSTPGNLSLEQQFKLQTAARSGKILRPRAGSELYSGAFTSNDGEG